MEKNKVENPLITIIVPVYNGERYINECVDSILQQDYKNIELLLINDGSRDNSGKIIDDYANKDNRVRAIHQKNAGVSTTRNNALDVAKGEYICLVDQDDYISKDYVSYFYNLILENDAEIATTPTARKFTSEKIKNNVERNIEDKVEVWTGVKAAEEMLYYNLIIAPWNKMISRSLIEENKIRFDCRYFGGEGFLFSLECFANAKKVAMGNKIVYNYRCDNPNSGMTKFSMIMIDSSINSQKTIKEKLLKNNPELKFACKYSNWHTYCDCLNFFIGCNVVKQHKEKYKEVKKVCRKDALCVLKASIPTKEKIKGIFYFISPYWTARLINHFRVRRFTVES